MRWSRCINAAATSAASKLLDVLRARILHRDSKQNCPFGPRLVTLRHQLPDEFGLAFDVAILVWPFR